MEMDGSDRNAACFISLSVLLGLGAIRAVIAISKDNYWEKTAHVGQHRTKAAA